MCKKGKNAPSCEVNTRQKTTERVLHFSLVYEKHHGVVGWYVHEQTPWLHLAFLVYRQSMLRGQNGGVCVDCDAQRAKLCVLSPMKSLPLHHIGYRERQLVARLSMWISSSERLGVNPPPGRDYEIWEALGAVLCHLVTSSFTLVRNLGLLHLRRRKKRWQIKRCCRIVVARFHLQVRSRKKKTKAAVKANWSDMKAEQERLQTLCEVPR